MQIACTDDTGVTRLELFVDDQPIALSGANATWTAGETGVHIATARTFDAAGHSAEHSQRIWVDDPSIDAQPIVEIHGPTRNSRISAPTTVTATVQSEALAEWVLEIVGKDKICGALEIARNTSELINQAAGEFRPDTPSQRPVRAETDRI